MKVGDLVKMKRGYSAPGVVLRVFMHKLWETDKMGKQINWDKIEKQPFAEVVWGDIPRGRSRVPQQDLKVISEAG